METITLFVKEATMERPIQELESLITALGGVERALVDIKGGEVKITYDSQKLSEKMIVEKIRQDGFHLAGELQE